MSLLRRGVALARDYANRRVAFGMPLSEHALHAETLAGLQAELEAGFHLSFYAVELLGRVEALNADEMLQNLLRLLTPVVKLNTAKQAVSGLSEVCECFGGAGYIEDTGIPTLLRDAQVLPIWEGTTNVLALDVLRVLRQIGGLQPWLTALRSLTSQIGSAEFEPAIRQIREAGTATADWMVLHSKSNDALTAGARGLSYTLGRTLALALLVRHADWALRAEHDPRPLAAMRRFARHGILRLHVPGEGEAKMLATDIYA
jgi:alkylation response protein AidB-like acyl-CoA dehydrogenase